MKFESSKGLTTYFKELEGKNHPLTKDEEQRLIPLAKAGDRAALTRILNSCSKFIVKTANHYMKQGVPVMDLVQEGNLGAIEAIHRFKFDEKTRFLSYAQLWIRKYVNDSVATVGKTVRLPMNKEFEIFKLKRAGLDVENISNVNIDKPIGDKGNMSILDFKVSSKPCVERNHEIEYTKELVNEYLNTIKKTRDKEILMAYYGIGRDVPLGNEDLSEIYGLTKSRISQIVKRTVEKFRENIIT